MSGKTIFVQLQGGGGGGGGGGDVSLKVNRGSVLGLVGQNGAGKTTLIKHILGLLKAESGQVRVFGANPVADPVSVPDARWIPLGTTRTPRVDACGRIHALYSGFLPRWDHSYALALRDQFGLSPASRLKTLSKGQRTKAALLAAQAHRPDLLLLDDGAPGPDPIVRNDILAAVIRTVAEEEDQGAVSFLRICSKKSNAFLITLLCCIKGDWSSTDLSKRSRHDIDGFQLHFDKPQPHPPNIPEALAIIGSGTRLGDNIQRFRSEASADRLQIKRADRR